jgi:hypothetical protein
VTCKHGVPWAFCEVCNGYSDYGPAKTYYWKEHVHDSALYTPREHTQNGYKDTQIGGDHYTKCAMQPYEYALANNFNYLESFALKYLTRHRDKGGKQDLEKLVHCVHLLIEAEYGPDTRKRD